VTGAVTRGCREVCRQAGPAAYLTTPCVPGQNRVYPPSMTTTDPVMKLDASDAR
jgi:hypothetical protein